MSRPSMSSPQALSEADRRTVAGWAADCAERALSIFEADVPTDDRPADAIARARAFSRGELDAAGVAHMGAHALGAAAYAAKAVGLARPDEPGAVDDEVHWQLAHATAQVRCALAKLPALGADPSGPLGPGLLARGVLADVIRQLQTEVSARAP